MQKKPQNCLRAVFSYWQKVFFLKIINCRQGGDLALAASAPSVSFFFFFYFWMEERKHKVQEITSPQIRPAQIWGLSKLALSCWSLRLNTQPARLNHGGFQSLGEISAVHFKDVCKSPQEAVFTLTLLTFQPDVFVHLRLCLSSTGAERRWFLEGLVLGSVHTISTFSVFCIKNCIWWPWAW